MQKPMRISAARRHNMYPYIPNTEKDEELMLKSMGMSSIDELFSDIPEDIRLNRSLNLGKGMSELEVQKYMKNLSNKNMSTEDLVCFLGAGAYDHYIPSAVKHITSRSEFYTAYTPYQPEISQGTLQVIFEYQTMMANLTGMDVSNASMYDGATACVEAALLCAENTKRKTVVVSKTVNPETRRVLKTYLRFRNIELVEIDYKDGVTDTEKLAAAINKDTAGVIVQSPNFFGIVEDYTEVEKLVHQNKSLFVVSVANAISLGVLKTPGEMGADLAVGEGQAFGNEINFGGPYLGFIASTSKLMRKLPGRICGETTDIDGKRAYVLTLQAREQHIRREKATSNICSNQGLCALAAAVYLSTLGKKGVKEAAVQCMNKAHYAYSKIIETGKFKPLFNKPFFDEFAVSSDIKAATVNSWLLKNGILGGYDLQKDYSELENSMLFCVTEKRTKDEIDNLTDLLKGIKEV